MIIVFLQLVGTAMGKKSAPHYACPCPRLLPLHFILTGCNLIKEMLKRFIDNILWQKDANINVFRELLHDLYFSLKFTVKKGKSSCEQNFDTFVQFLALLDGFFLFYIQCVG